MKVEHYADAQTMEGKIRKPIQRHDSATLDPNPVRRFREELRLTRDAFAELMGIPVETLRAWERHEKAVVPGQSRMNRLIECARRNHYPLLIMEIVRFSEGSKK